MKDPAFLADFKGGLSDSIFREMLRAYRLKDALLAMDKQQGRVAGARPMLHLAAVRMADGAATLAILLSHIWIDAGNPPTTGGVQINVPAWVPPQYSLTQLARSSYFENR